jgi:hypothetical protein
MLMGRGPFEGVDNQLQYPPQAYEQIAIAGTRALRELPTKGEKTLELTSILQGPDEPYQEFLAHLLQNISRVVVGAKAGNILVNHWLLRILIRPVKQPFSNV